MLNKGLLIPSTPESLAWMQGCGSNDRVIRHDARELLVLKNVQTQSCLIDASIWPVPTITSPTKSPVIVPSGDSSPSLFRKNDEVI